MTPRRSCLVKGQGQGQKGAGKQQKWNKVCHALVTRVNCQFVQQNSAKATELYTTGRWSRDDLLAINTLVNLSRLNRSDTDAIKKLKKRLRSRQISDKYLANANKNLKRTQSQTRFLVYGFKKAVKKQIKSNRMVKKAPRAEKLWSLGFG